MNKAKVFSIIKELADIADQELGKADSFGPAGDWVWLWCEIVKRAQEVRNNMTQEEKALAFVSELVERFREDIDNMKAGKEPMCFQDDALNHMVSILTDAGKIIDDE